MLAGTGPAIGREIGSEAGSAISCGIRRELGSEAGAVGVAGFASGAGASERRGYAAVAGTPRAHQKTP
ncbi:hypothetical protein FB559_0958 [Actinoallomurus bryophytorum]|uniref:Uncharacterized protein n=1 Tax=Actinoallomurus bryophytorum TaxID=1490222 RepID=A0A543CED8_9ACTN|nr:hypothetical protein [Actinoallomurus bryophytorum]TQL95455.1 hypothetical protein FB559_0958 [Actinoallomurus bryophytorum]